MLSRAVIESIRRIPSGYLQEIPYTVKFLSKAIVHILLFFYDYSIDIISNKLLVKLDFYYTKAQKITFSKTSKKQLS